jgi:hypothetical protein
MNTSNQSLPAGHIAFYALGLACEAAPHIACGIRAKPILASLEASALVVNAWFSRSGTTLAVEWVESAIRPDQEMAVIRAALRYETSVPTRIVDAPAVEGLQRTFGDGRAWYRKNEIDELSEEESWVIASRLVQRMLTTVDLDAQRQDAVRRVVAHASAGMLTTSEPGTLATREKLLAEAILNAACRELTLLELEALRRAIASGGYRPVEGSIG